MQHGALNRDIKIDHVPDCMTDGAMRRRPYHATKRLPENHFLVNRNIMIQ